MEDITKMSVNELLSHRDELQERCDYNASRIDDINQALSDRKFTNVDELEGGFLLIKVDPKALITSMWDELALLKLQHIKSFRKLHEYIDANMLGDEAYKKIEMEVQVEILNHCQEVIDNMLKMKNG